MFNSIPDATCTVQLVSDHFDLDSGINSSGSLQVER